MMWGEVRCGEIFSKNCEVRWGAETLFFEKCLSLINMYLVQKGHIDFLTNLPKMGFYG